MGQERGKPARGGGGAVVSHYVVTTHTCASNIFVNIQMAIHGQSRPNFRMNIKTLSKMTRRSFYDAYLVIKSDYMQHIFCYAEVRLTRIRSLIQIL